MADLHPFIFQFPPTKKLRVVDMFISKGNSSKIQICDCERKSTSSEVQGTEAV